MDKVLAHIQANKKRYAQYAIALASGMVAAKLYQIHSDKQAAVIAAEGDNSDA